LHGINDWSNAVFVSPSPSYAACPVYAGRIPCNERIYCCLVEAMIVNNQEFFNTSRSTTPSYSKALGEPDDLEFRVDKRHSDSFSNLSQLLKT